MASPVVSSLSLRRRAAVRRLRVALRHYGKHLTVGRNGEGDWISGAGLIPVKRTCSNDGRPPVGGTEKICSAPPLRARKRTALPSGSHSAPRSPRLAHLKRWRCFIFIVAVRG